MTPGWLHRDRVSERSLELNVMSETLMHARRSLPRAYVVGYTASEEAGHGLDVSIDAPGITMSAFQFKAVKSGRGNIYRFRIGDRCWVCSNPRVGSRRTPLDKVRSVLERLGLLPGCLNQHVLLFATSLVLEGMGILVYYAFPLIRDYNELESRIQKILDYTILVRVSNMPIRTVLDCKPHTIEIFLRNNNPVNAVITIHSEDIKLPEGKYYTLSKVLEKIIKDTEEAKRRELPRESHLEPDDLRKLLEAEFSKRVRQEGLGPEFSDRAIRLAKAITEISFRYRGTLFITNR